MFLFFTNVTLSVDIFAVISYETLCVQSDTEWRNSL